MTQLEFFREPDLQAIALAQAGEPAIIPNVGDQAYVRADRNSPAHLLIAGRKFIYDEDGALTTVRLSCTSLPDDSPPEHHQRRPADDRVTLRRHLSSGDARNIDPPFSCPRCACVMTLHQPDPELTECLLAICEYCKAWYLTNPTETKLSLIRQPRDRPSRQ